MDTDKETTERIEKKLDEVLKMKTTIDALGRILIRHRTAVNRGINKSTIDQNKNVTKHKEVGHKRVFVEIGEVGTIPQRKSPKRRS
jgi:hypothetical protein